MSKDHVEGQNAGTVFQLGRSLCFPGVKRQSEGGKLYKENCFTAVPTHMSFAVLN